MGSTPSSSTWDSDLPPTASPHGLSRGQTPFSSSSTRQPFNALYAAAAEPPGPPPTTMTSNAVSSSGTTPVSIGCSHCSICSPYSPKGHLAFKVCIELIRNHHLGVL